ncbi:MAG: Gfo/Idh/MocA family oxidoreductase [Victivallales bacterium]|nr:Gfo/Idh/MocA family oxidoreductase [Victivallales bacterium]
MAKKLKVALIGFGGMGHFHATQYADQKNCELVAIVDHNPMRFKELSSSINLGKSDDMSLKGIRQFATYEDLMGEMRPDVLDICLPGHLHAEYAIRAMKDGLDVLCEKPMARNVSQADRMLRTAKATGRHFMIAQCLRFSPVYNAFRDIYKRKTYGKLLRIHSMRLSGAAYGSEAWYRDAEKSGGALLDLHLHDVDFYNYMFGLPVAVSAVGVTRVSGGIDDVLASFIYSENFYASAEASWLRSGWFCNAVAVYEKATVSIQGDDIVVAKTNQNKAGATETRKTIQGKNGYWGEIDYFTGCLQTGREPDQCAPQSTRDSIRICLAEEKSIQYGRPVKI